jgi:arsenate reductase (thioredoxin)
VTRTPDGIPTVLFVCHHNANRSQIAAGYLESLAGSNVRVRSAGPQPAEALNPAAVEVMAEDGIDIADATPLQLTPALVQQADVVITLGCADAVHPDGTRHEDWILDTSPGHGIDAARAVRDQIRHRVEVLAASL